MYPDLFDYRDFFPPFSNKYATTLIAYSNLRLRANGRNIVDQQLPTLLDVTCCVRLYTLLHVVECCCANFETGQTFQPIISNISFVL